MRTHKNDIKYMVFDPIHELSRLDRLFRLVGRIEPLERLRILARLGQALGITEETATWGLDSIGGWSEDLQQRFCELANARVSEPFLVYSIVAFALNGLRSQCNEHVIAWEARKNRLAIQYYKKQLAAGRTHLGIADKIVRRAEEYLNNQEANQRLAQDRYERFCTDVVPYLLPKTVKMLSD